MPSTSMSSANEYNSVGCSHKYMRRPRRVIASACKWICRRMHHETSLGGPLHDVAEIHCSVAVFTLATLALGEELFRLLAEVALCVVCRLEPS